MESSKEHKERRIETKLLWPLLSMATALILLLSLAKPRNAETGSAVVQHSEANKPGVDTSSSPVRAATAQDTVIRTANQVQEQSNLSARNAGANLTDKEVEARAAELMKLAMNDDAGSLQTILKEIRNPNRALRDAALQAAIQFGSRDAIPTLNEAAQQADDPAERTQLLNAVEFLKLPSLTEVMLNERAPEAPGRSVSAR